MRLILSKTNKFLINIIIKPKKLLINCIEITFYIGIPIFLYSILLWHLLSTVLYIYYSIVNKQLYNIFLLLFMGYDFYPFWGIIVQYILISLLYYFIYKIIRKSKLNIINEYFILIFDLYSVFISCSIIYLAIFYFIRQTPGDFKFYINSILLKITFGDAPISINFRLIIPIYLSIIYFVATSHTKHKKDKLIPYITFISCVIFYGIIVYLLSLLLSLLF